MIETSGKVLAAALLLGAACAAHAQNADIVSQMGGEKEIRLYKSPSKKDFAGMIPAQGFPWKVKSKSKGFYEVATPAGSGWVNSLDVNTAPTAMVVCTVPPGSKSIAGSMNASSDRCRQP
ncbi:hypothetical protein AWB68_03902 [Caballeronia choica]|jgi:hypothetical protein|uniref:Uncharacterized protein n=2 Tax=Caballeronia choica TaxID=326476 RepID=A0A158JKB5_9BURK|nr:hypothetical protein AWB68_03902 [Caballeronia choica]